MLGLSEVVSTCEAADGSMDSGVEENRRELRFLENKVELWSHELGFFWRVEQLAVNDSWGGGRGYLLFEREPCS